MNNRYLARLFARYFVKEIIVLLNCFPNFFCIFVRESLIWSVNRDLSFATVSIPRIKYLFFLAVES